MKKLLAALIVVVILIPTCFVGLNMYISSAEAPFDEGDTTYYDITVPSGASTTTISELLEEKGIVASAQKFVLLAKKNGYDGKFQAGDFVLSPSMTGTELMDALCYGKYSTMRFTVPEGLTVAQTADKLAEDGIVDRDAFMNEAINGTFDYGFMSMLPTGENRLEGVLLPETYDVYETASAHDIVDRMLAQFDSIFNEEAMQRCDELGYSPYDVLIIASIIEKEAKVDQDRPLISSVIYNRLAIGQRLEMCSTVLYALGDNKGYVTLADTQYDSPYNTYMYAGLPPMPICSPGAKAIEAALYPADTDYYYFVVSEKLDGSHNFSSDYNDFLKDKEAYQNAINN